jgi:hypothetical protein
VLKFFNNFLAPFLAVIRFINGHLILEGDADDGRWMQVANADVDRRPSQVLLREISGIAYESGGS